MPLSEKIESLATSLFIEDIKKSIPLSSFTTLKIGGLSDFFYEAKSITEFTRIFRKCLELDIPVFVLGGGSNLLISDAGFRGLTLRNCDKEIRLLSDEELQLSFADSLTNSHQHKYIYSSAGANIAQLVNFCINEGLEGLEYHLGLPGSVGGAVALNSNFPAKNAFVGDYVFSAKILSPDGKVKTVDKSYFEFEYDYSVLQDKSEIILSVIFALPLSEQSVLSLRGKESIQHRNKTQPKGYSAGCFFRNITPQESIEAGIPNGITSAGYLIDKAGLKGLRVGGAVVSDIHANYILNVDNASAKDVTDLIEIIRERVFYTFGIKLVLEVKLIGF